MHSLLSDYATTLETLASALDAHADQSAWQVEARAAVDGRLSETARLAVSAARGKYEDAFFSGEKLAAALLEPHLPFNGSNTQILDPACGTGDLLAAAAWHLPLEPSLRETLEKWGTVLFGYDIHDEFIRLTKARLALIAQTRHSQPMSMRPEEVSRAFPNIRRCDGIEALRSCPQGGLILMNPPFGRSTARASYKHGVGRVSQAAVFLDACLDAMAQGAEVAAILPDVLRSGSNYRKLRASVEDRARITSVQVVGAFNKWVDIDVFVLRAVAGERNREPVSWWEEPRIANHRLSDFFDVSVGSVVPHRDEENGPPRPFLFARLLPKGGVFNAEDAPLRQFQARNLVPPFAVVRRTSSPSDRQRLVSTIVEGSQPVTVENHLLVVQPTSSATLEELQRALAAPGATAWLNQRLRCRHVTVAALRDLPWVSS